MYKSVSDRKADAISSNPAILEFINDLPSELASSAFHNVSFSPEQRGLEAQVEYALRITGQKAKVAQEIEYALARGAIVDDSWQLRFESWFETFRQRMRALYLAYLHSMSACASPMITGPARFPVERQRKRNLSADNKYAAISAYASHSPARFLKRIMPFGNGSSISSNAPNANAILTDKLKERVELQEKMKAANKIVARYFKKGSALGVSQEQKEECVQQLVTDLNFSLDAAKSLLQPNDYSGKIIAFWPYQLSNNNQEIRRLEQRVLEVARLQQKAPEIAQTLVNGIEIRKSDDGKIEIHFGYKPDVETRDFLSSKAFKFSKYRNNAWVRKITVNAMAAFERDVKPMLERLPKI